MPASQLFSLTLALLFAIINRHRVQRRFLCSGIEAVITGLTRKFEAFWLICPRGLASHGAESGVCIKIFPAYLASKSCIFLNILQGGELSEWSMVQPSKDSRPLVNLSARNGLTTGFSSGAHLNFPLLSCIEILHFSKCLAGRCLKIKYAAVSKRS